MRTNTWLIFGFAVIALSFTACTEVFYQGQAPHGLTNSVEGGSPFCPPPVENFEPLWTNPVEAAYAAIWRGFYGPGKGKFLLKASPKLLPDGRPAFEVDPKTDEISLEIFLDVDTHEFQDWRRVAHERLATLGNAQCRPVALGTPGSRIIGGRAFQFSEEGEACIRRWETSRAAKKTAIAVRVESFTKKGKPVLQWSVPLRLFTRNRVEEEEVGDKKENKGKGKDHQEIGKEEIEEYAKYPCPLHSLNRLLDIPQSIWQWAKPEDVPNVECERAFFKMPLPKLSPFRAASIATITCTMIDEGDFMPDLLKAVQPEISQLEEDMVEVPGKNYSMCRYEVTQALWAAVMGKKASANPSVFLGTNLPVESVTWDSCQEFLDKLNKRPIFKLRGHVYKLPTEEEWEYACRAGAEGAFCLTTNGTEVTAETLGDMAWISDNSGRETHPVGEKEPNAFGLYDMHGNVWEWTTTMEESDRIIKGGGWNGDAIRCESSNRNRYHPAHGNPFLGFRLLRKTVDPR